MTFYFNAHRTYVARDKHDPRRRWRVYKFTTSRGVITLVREMQVRRIVRKVMVYV